MSALKNRDAHIWDINPDVLASDLWLLIFFETVDFISLLE